MSRILGWARGWLSQVELGETVQLYKALKERTGKLDFLDLLIRARDLVVQSSNVRTYFQERFCDPEGPSLRAARP